MSTYNPLFAGHVAVDQATTRRFGRGVRLYLVLTESGRAHVTWIEDFLGTVGYTRPFDARRVRRTKRGYIDLGVGR